jgi:hypothetical protein
MLSFIHFPASTIFLSAAIEFGIYNYLTLWLETPRWIQFLQLLLPIGSFNRTNAVEELESALGEESSCNFNSDSSEKKEQQRL